MRDIHDAHVWVQPPDPNALVKLEQGAKQHAPAAAWQYNDTCRTCVVLPAHDTAGKGSRRSTVCLLSPMKASAQASLIA